MAENETIQKAEFVAENTERYAVLMHNLDPELVEAPVQETSNNGFLGRLKKLFR